MSARSKRAFRAAHPLYDRWQAIIKRCEDPLHPRWCDWGGRGIQVAAEWRRNFPAFEAYMMALPNALWPGYSIDRIDNNGHYAPGNVRWSTAADQRRNQRNSPWPFGVLAHEKDQATQQAEELIEAEMRRRYRERRERELSA